MLLEPAADLAGPAHGVAEVFRADEYVGERRERRIAHPPPVRAFLVEEGSEVMGGRELDRIVLGEIGLEYHLSRRGTPSGTPGHLGEQVEGAFGGAEVGESEGEVGADHADES